jgi:zinc protease
VPELEIMPRAVSRLVLALVVLPCFIVAPVRADTAKPLFDYREITLDNGLHVITLEDSSCPIVAIQLWYHVGSKDERADRQGFAHMFEHMMFRGTDRLGPKDHFDLIRRSGGNCNAYTSFDQTVYIDELPANQLELALWLEAERLAFLKIDQTSFDTERKVVEEERRLGLNRPYGTLFEKVVKEMFKVHPYGWTPIGKISHLRASATQELRDFWLRHYVPNNATLVIVGDVKHAEAQRLAKKCFGWIPREAEPARVTVREPMPTKARDVTIREDNAPAPGVGLVWRTVPGQHDDSTALDLLASILGGGDSSRLYRRLVAEQQLAVAAVAGSSALEQEGIFAAGAVLTPIGGDTSKVLGVVREEVDKLRREPVSAKELIKARNQMLSSVVTQRLTVSSKASVLGSAAVIEGDLSRVNRQLDRIRRVTAEDLLRVAKTHLAPERAMSVTIERNLLGTLMGSRSPEIKSEEDAPITAKPETGPVPPARAGLRRPADWPAKPPVNQVLDTRLTIPHTKHTLANGLKVMVVPNDEVPYISVELGLLAGAWTESKPGTASLALGMLTKGTTRHTEKQLAEELETYAINLSGGGGMDTSSVNAGCLTEHVDRAVRLMAEVVLEPTFPPDEFEKLRKQVLTGLAVSSQEPSYKAGREMRRRLYGAHPYARTATGEVADVKALAASDLNPWWATFARPDQAVLIFAGDITAEKALRLAEAAFGTWKVASAKPEVSLPPLPLRAPTHIYLINHPGSTQSQIRVSQLAIKRDHPGWPTGRVVSDYFGGSFGSRLNDLIRVKKGLTYGAGGGYGASRFAGQFSMSTFSKTESTGETLRAVLDELERLRRDPPSATELRDTKSYFIGSFASERETPQQVAGELWTIQSYGLPDDYYERLLEKVSHTDADSCLHLVQETIDPKQVIVVVVGLADRIQKDLEKIAPVTVVRLDKDAAPDKKK